MTDFGKTQNQTQQKYVDVKTPTDEGDIDFDQFEMI